MATNPLSGPKFRALDSNGNPLSGGKLYSYSAGTSTPLSTYTTRAGSVPNANPAVLDANGEADVWLEAGVDYKFVLKNSADVTQWTVDNFPSPAETSTTDSVTTDPGGRLTLTSATPVTTTDVNAATTVYYVPYKHDKVPLYDGAAWSLHSISSELSQATTDNTKSPAAAAINSIYDLFIWDDSGTLRLSRGPAWTSDTGRGSGAGTTELERLNGRLVNKASISNGPAARRGLYVGTIRTDGSAQAYDARLYRYVWNMYNRAERISRAVDSIDTWTYNTATWRQARGSTLNSVSFVRGLDEDAVSARVVAAASVTIADATVYVGIGLDSSTTPAVGCLLGLNGFDLAVVPNGRALAAEYKEWAGLGYHYLAWIERGDGGGGTVTWCGDNGNSTLTQCGLHVTFLA